MKKALLPILLGLFVVCGVGGYLVFQMRPKPPKADPNGTATVERGEVSVTVVATGIIDATESVEVKSRVTGRLSQLRVDEGDTVRRGDLIAVVDPQETRLRVAQDEAQLAGAMSGVRRAGLEIDQRRQTVQASYEQAKVRVAQLELEVRAQPTLTRATIEQAQTQLNTARQERERLAQSAHPTERQNSLREIDEARVSLENAQREYDRRLGLERQGFVAGREVETAQLQLDLAKLRLKNAQENDVKLQSRQAVDLRKADEQIREAMAGVRRAQANSFQDVTKQQELVSARADLDKARAALMDPAVLRESRAQSQATVRQLSSVLSDSRRQLSETEIRAPFDGLVTRRGAKVGELVTGLSTFGSGTTIIRLEDRSRMRVKLDVNEIDVAKMRVGMAASVEVDALPNQQYKGIVRKIAPSSKSAGDAAAAAAANQVVKYEVEIELTGATDELRSGMTAKCRITVQDASNALRLPSAFVARDAETREYYVVTGRKGGGGPMAKAEDVRKTVKVGAISGAFIEITEGVAEGEKVLKPNQNFPARKGVMQAGRQEDQ